MLDLGFVRDHLPLVEEKLRQRGMVPATILKDFHAIDLERRAAITQAETLKAQRNKATEEIAKLKKEKLDATALINETKQLRENISEAEKHAEESDARLRNILTGIPNLPDDSVPLGKSEADNVEGRRWGTPPQFDFTPKPHWELGEHLGVLDLERAAKLTGARFAVYWDMGAKLERALMNFMLDLHTREHGYTEVLPPFLVNADSMYGTGQLPKFEADLFKVPLDKFEPDTEWMHKPGDLVRRAQEEGVFRVWEVDKEGRTAEIQLASGIGTRRHGTPWSLLLRRRDLYLIPTAEVPVTNPNPA